MPERFELPEIPLENPAGQPLSRKERRGKKKGKQHTIDGGKVHDPGRVSVPAAKHMNYRRG